MPMTERRLLVLAIVTDLCDHDVTYPTCQQCYSKLFLDQLTENHRYHCLKCGWSCELHNVQWRYRLVLAVADSQATGKVVVFGGTLNDFFGKTATDFQRSVQGLRESGYPAESIVTDALVKRFMGKYFYFGFKVSGYGPCDQSEPVSLQDVLQSTVETQSQRNAENSHTLAYQMIASNDGVYATVADHIRFTLKSLKRCQNKDLVDTSKECQKEKTVPVDEQNWLVVDSMSKRHNAALALSQHQTKTGCDQSHTDSESDCSDVCGTSSLYAKQCSVRFSFEQSTRCSSAATASGFTSRPSFHKSCTTHTKNGSYLSESRKFPSQSTCEQEPCSEHQEGKQNKCSTQKIQNQLAQKLDFSSQSEFSSVRSENLGHILKNNKNHDGMSCSEANVTWEQEVGNYCGESYLENSSFDPYLSKFSKQSNSSLVTDKIEPQSINIETGHVSPQQPHTANDVFGIESIQNMYLPESEDLNEFLDTFEEDSEIHVIDKKQDSTHNPSEPVSYNGDDDDCSSQANDTESKACTIDQTANQSELDPQSTNTVEVSLRDAEDLRIMYLPESEDLEEFLNSFDDSFALSDSMCNIMSVNCQTQESVMNAATDSSNIKTGSNKNVNTLDRIKSQFHCEQNKHQAVSVNKIHRNCFMDVSYKPESCNNHSKSVCETKLNNSQSFSVYRADYEPIGEVLEDDSGFSQSVDFTGHADEDNAVDLKQPLDYHRKKPIETCDRTVGLSAKEPNRLNRQPTDVSNEQNVMASKFVHNKNERQSEKNTLSYQLDDVEKFFADISLENGKVDQGGLIIEKNNYRNRIMANIDSGVQAVKLPATIKPDQGVIASKSAQTNSEVHIPVCKARAENFKQNPIDSHICQDEICWCQHFEIIDMSAAFSQKVEKSEQNIDVISEKMKTFDKSHDLNTSIKTLSSSKDIDSNGEKSGQGNVNIRAVLNNCGMPYVFNSSPISSPFSQDINSNNKKTDGSHTGEQETLDTCENEDDKSLCGDLTEGGMDESMDQSADLFSDGSFYDQISNTTETSRIKDQSYNSIDDNGDEKYHSVKDALDENIEFIVESQDFNESKEKSSTRSSKDYLNCDPKPNKDAVTVGRKVQFDYRLQRVSNCHLMDLKMKRNDSPLENLGKTPLPKSCLKSTKNLVRQGRFESPLLTRCEENVEFCNEDRLFIYQGNQVSNNAVDVTYVDGSQDLFGSSPAESLKNKQSDIAILRTETSTQGIQRVANGSVNVNSLLDSPDLFSDSSMYEDSQLQVKNDKVNIDPVTTPDLFSQYDAFGKVDINPATTPDLFSHRDAFGKVDINPATTPDLFSQCDIFDSSDSDRGKENVCDNKVCGLYSNNCSSIVKNNKSISYQVPFKDKTDRNPLFSLFKLLVDDTPSSEPRDKAGAMNIKDVSGESVANEAPSVNRAALRVLQDHVGLQESPDLFGSPMSQSSCDGLNEACLAVESDTGESPLCKKLFF